MESDTDTAAKAKVWVRKRLVLTRTKRCLPVIEDVHSFLPHVWGSKEVKLGHLTKETVCNLSNKCVLVLVYDYTRAGRGQYLGQESPGPVRNLKLLTEFPFVINNNKDIFILKMFKCLKLTHRPNLML